MGKRQQGRGCHGGSPRAVERGALTRFAVMLVDVGGRRLSPTATELVMVMLAVHDGGCRNDAAHACMHVLM
jgi:hypothetical protein